jgi:hypothetical protein
MSGIDSIGVAMGGRPNVVIAGTALLPDTIFRDPLIVAVHEAVDTNGTYRFCVNSVSPAPVVLWLGDERQDLDPSYFVCVDKRPVVPSVYWFETTIFNVTYHTPRYDIS